MSNNYLDWQKKLLIAKNLQFLSYTHETWSKWLPLELVILTKFHEYRTKIVDFLLIETFLASPDNCVQPSICKIFSLTNVFLNIQKCHSVMLRKCSIPMCFFCRKLCGKLRNNINLVLLCKHYIKHKSLNWHHTFLVFWNSAQCGKIFSEVALFDSI